MLVVPSRWEGFGLVAVEAMRVGKPVLAAAAGGLNDILDGGRYGITVPVNDPVALRAAIETLSADRLTALAEAGHARFHDRYTAQRMTDDLDRVYAGLA